LCTEKEQAKHNERNKERKERKESITNRRERVEIRKIDLVRKTERKEEKG
jgi:hypothetical protein